MTDNNDKFIEKMRNEKEEEVFTLRPQAIDELTKPKILQSPVTNIRWAAVIAVGTLGDYRVIDHLLEVLDDREWIVRNQAVTELKDKIQEIIQLVIGSLHSPSVCVNN